MNYFDTYDLYYENLLLLQYDASELFQHMLTKGEIREEFIIDVLQKQYTNVRFARGVITDGNIQSGQNDIIILKKGARIRTISNGNTICAEPKDCHAVIEVKSNATGTDIRRFEQKVEELKSIDKNNSLICGMFCYKVSLKKTNLLKMFGYRFDKDLDSYINGMNREIHHLDFFLNIQKEDLECIEDQVYFLKDNLGGYQLQYDYPMIKNFFALLDGLNCI
ncbi:hypothetical protein EDC14_1002183 [Hydrogenispora ethanolica]|uniref:DUF6602 domain-containing protein n=1 Tax=Hydrogenispora ethanolica TaxID=1082276 RepID=A0A4R1SB06_HYDET|nr:DUF6602 domain-containing protein [Hydrogenispora ethanolica]TCL76424.1 hypothetical protein EDC14_1002183 [Hydrogenispora ethanolica]